MFALFARVFALQRNGDLSPVDFCLICFFRFLLPGRNLLDWIGLGTGGNNDPYLSRANAACLNGDLAECFKSRALNTFDEFFDATKVYISFFLNVLCVFGCIYCCFMFCFILRILFN